MNKTCNTTVVIEAALDVESIKLTEKPQARLLHAGHIS